MKKEELYQTYTKNFTSDELENMKARAKKRIRFFFALFLLAVAVGVIVILLAILFGSEALLPVIPAVIIPFLILWGVFAGCGCFANNIYRILKSHGKKSGGLITLFWALYGGLLVPLIVISVCNRSLGKPFTLRILGWENIQVNS